MTKWPGCGGCPPFEFHCAKRLALNHATRVSTVPWWSNSRTLRFGKSRWCINGRHRTRFIGCFTGKWVCVWRRISSLNKDRAWSIRVSSLRRGTYSRCNISRLSRRFSRTSSSLRSCHRLQLPRRVGRFENSIPAWPGNHSPDENLLLGCGKGKVTRMDIRSIANHCLDQSSYRFLYGEVRIN